MTDIFLTVLNMSITAAFVIAVLCLARLALRKIRAPKWISYALWGVAGFNLVCPFKLESALSLIPFNSAPIPHDIAMQVIPRIDSGISIIDGAVSSSLPAATPMASVNPLQMWTAVGTYVWLAGVAAMLLYAVISYVRLIRRKDGVTTPFVYGFIKPKMHIPGGLAEKELRYVTLHEQTHIKRRDYLVKMFAFALLCIHWFNPFAWLAFVLLCADMEMSCDERVLRELGPDVKADYSQTLLSLSMNRRIPGASPLAFGEGGIKGRIKNVLEFKKRSRIITVAAVAFATMLTVGFAVNTASHAGNAVYNNPESAFASLSKYLPNVVIENLSFFREDTVDDGTLWLWYNEDHEGYLHKLEVTENDGVISRYHYKNYCLDIPANVVSFETASVMALDFASDFIAEGALLFENKPYENNIYDPGTVESWVAKSDIDNVEYVIMVNMAYGYVEQFTVEPISVRPVIDTKSTGNDFAGEAVAGYDFEGHRAFVRNVEQDGVFWVDVRTTTDAGETWTEVRLPKPQNSQSDYDGTGFSSAIIGFTSQTEGFIIGSVFYGMGNQENYVYKSDDSGNSWHEVNNVNDSYSRVLNFGAFADAHIGFLAFRLESFDDPFPLYRTKDGGQTWEKTEIPAIQQPSESYYDLSWIQFGEDDYRIALSIHETDTVDKYLISSDRGATWRLSAS